jgi:hypothetical protein
MSFVDAMRFYVQIKICIGKAAGTTMFESHDIVD